LQHQVEHDFQIGQLGVKDVSLTLLDFYTLCNFIWLVKYVDNQLLLTENYIDPAVHIECTPDEGREVVAPAFMTVPHVSFT